MKITKINYREKLLITSSLEYLLDEGYFKRLEDVLGEDIEEFAKDLINYITDVPSEEAIKSIHDKMLESVQVSEDLDLNDEDYESLFN